MRTSVRLVWLSVATTAVVVAACKGREQGAAAGPAAGPSDTGAGVTAVALRHYTGNPDSARMGRALFIRYNCYGCHGGLAGGAMGPSLRDTIWKYGGTDSAITMSISQGRPLGMPTWKGIIPPDQIRLIVDYIHSLRTDAEPKFFFIQIDSSGKIVLPSGNGVNATVGGATTQ
jgi:mono/diheme cytochrome c family protein